MRFAGLFLLLAGFGLTVAALYLLPGAGMRAIFVSSGVGVELLGLGVLVRAQMELRS
jgi:hypothetical protein